MVTGIDEESLVYVEFLEEFSGWITYEEERREWEEIFFRDYFPQLPLEIVDRVKARYSLDYLKTLAPFSLQFAPILMKFLIRDITRSVS